MTSILLRLLIWCQTAMACSNFRLDNEYELSGRTMDVGDAIRSWGLQTVPRKMEQDQERFGYVRFLDLSLRDGNLTEGGINEAGLSCDMQHLNNSTYPKPSKTKADVWVGFLCDVALSQFNSSIAFSEAVASGKVHFHGRVSESRAADQHFVLRDADGVSAIVEFEHPGTTRVYIDRDDQGKSGFGVLTNEPPFPWHLQNVQHMMWKQSLALPAVAIPGAYYPDERFLRLVLLKAALRKPTAYKDAVMQAVFLMNSVTVPPGHQQGTDSPASYGRAGLFDHTNFGALYDHKQAIVYWRSEFNMNLQRLRLRDVPLVAGAAQKTFDLGSDAVPWFEDAAHALH
jgi:choloylglycine hydrolase